MDYRERLLRTEIRMISENLRIISEEFMLMQDFITVEFADRFNSFIKGRGEERKPTRTKSPPLSSPVKLKFPTNITVERVKVPSTKSKSKKRSVSPVETKTRNRDMADSTNPTRRSSRPKCPVVVYNPISDEEDVEGEEDEDEGTDIQVDPNESVVLQLQDDGEENHISVEVDPANHFEMDYQNDSDSTDTRSEEREINHNQENEIDNESEHDDDEDEKEETESDIKTELQGRDDQPEEIADTQRSCPVCKGTFDILNLLDHVRSHLKEDTEDCLVCRICGEQFLTKSKLKRHKETRHAKNDRYNGTAKCGFCGLICRDKSRLRDHERSHTNEKPFNCNVCGKNYTRKDILTRHLRNVHGAVSSST